jgi:hypothetical protein
MKLIRCKSCNDIIALHKYRRLCACGKSFGYYIDSTNAVYGGDAVPLGILNSTLHEAIACQPEGGRGKTFVAFVIPKQCDTFERIDDENG